MTEPSMRRLPWRLPPTLLRAALAPAIVVPICVGIVADLADLADLAGLAVSLTRAAARADVLSRLHAWRRVGAGGTEAPR